MGNQQILNGADIQLDRLTKLGDPLEKVNAAIDWEIFRAPIRKRVRKEDYSKGGRPPMDEIMMFKITLLQDWDNISYQSRFQNVLSSVKTLSALWRFASLDTTFSIWDWY